MEMQYHPEMCTGLGPDDECINKSCKCVRGSTTEEGSLTWNGSFSPTCSKQKEKEMRMKIRGEIGEREEKKGKEEVKK